MQLDWSVLCDHFGVKRVTWTDKDKGAYVLTEDQRNALSAAGKVPAARGVFSVEVLFDPSTSAVEVSYYESVREGSGRAPEVRMGRGIINWAKVGDEIVIGNKGRRIIVAKVSAIPKLAGEMGLILARRGDKKKIVRQASQATKKPARRMRQISDFVRDPYVVAAALLRASENCEMPSCKHSMFKRDDGSVFLEVHHITPLSEDGDDSLGNAAGLCPSCHRELHHGVGRLEKRALLFATVANKPLP